MRRLLLLSCLILCACTTANSETHTGSTASLPTTTRSASVRSSMPEPTAPRLGTVIQLPEGAVTLAFKEGPTLQFLGTHLEPCGGGSGSNNAPGATTMVEGRCAWVHYDFLVGDTKEKIKVGAGTRTQFTVKKIEYVIEAERSEKYPLLAMGKSDHMIVVMTMDEFKKILAGRPKR